MKITLFKKKQNLGFTDLDYKNLGVTISNSEKEIISNADIIVQLGLPSDEKLSFFRENQILIGVLNPFTNIYSRFSFSKT